MECEIPHAGFLKCSAAKIRTVARQSDEAAGAAAGAWPAVRRAGKAAGTLTADRQLAHEYLEQGALFVVVGVDTSILVNAARELAAEFTGASRSIATDGGY
jgi:4-hydroxy-2-oxoheptanedioate aldolase